MLTSYLTSGRYAESTMIRSKSGQEAGALTKAGPLHAAIIPMAHRGTRRIHGTSYGDLVRPERLPKPTCTVWLICGPPAAGKSTYVKAHARPDDIVIDIDAIAREYGFGRERPSEATAMLLLDRNERLAALATEPHERVAWVITGGASQEQRHWWCDVLGVECDHLIMLVPPREELYRRIMSDPDRRSVHNLHMRLVDKWFAQEQ